MITSDVGGLDELARAHNLTPITETPELISSHEQLHVGDAVITIGSAYRLEGDGLHARVVSVSVGDQVRWWWMLADTGHRAAMSALIIHFARAAGRLELDVPLMDPTAPMLDVERGWLGVYFDTHRKGWWLLSQMRPADAAESIWYAAGRRHDLQCHTAETLLNAARIYRPNGTPLDRLLFCRVWDALYAWQQSYTRAIRHDALQTILAEPRHNGLVSQIARLFAVKRQAVYQMARTGGAVKQRNTAKGN